MKRKRKFYCLLGLLLLLVLLDGLLTYLNTPDLAREGNPLVVVFGLGWGALFLANFLFLAVAFVAGRYAFVSYKTVEAPVANRREYLSQMFYGRPDKFVWSLYRLPKNWAPYGAMFGYVLIPFGIFHRAILVFEWLTTNVRVPVYDQLRAMVPYGRLDIVLSLPVMVFLFIFWFEGEYRRCRWLTAVADQ